jgi:hypothetical protein
MIGYACLVLIQTLAALALLAVIGGWTLWPFRTSTRPYLWLAAPLTGIAILSLTLTILYHTFGLALPLCLAICVPVSVAPTLVCLVRRWRQGGPVPGWKTGLAALLGIGVWGAFASNGTAIRCGEPTVSMRDGSDTFGYAQVASWILQHPQEQASWNPSKPHEAYVHVMDADPRPGAFLLTAAAGFVRQTTPVFSFDWLMGVALAAGVLALAGCFASGRGTLVLLLCAGILSSWFTLAHSGYLGKVLAYPGCILLASLLFSTWRQLSINKLLAGALLGLGVGLCHSPATPVTILGLLFGGSVLALASHWLPTRSGSDQLQTQRADWQQFGRGLLVLAALLGPLMLLFSWWLWGLASAPPSLDLAKTRLLSFALDLDNPHVPLVGPRLARWLVGLALILNAIGWALAYRARHIEAASCLLSVGVLVLVWRGHHWGLSHFAGILFPLSAIGVTLLLEEHQHVRAPRFVNAAVLMIALAMIGLRIVQFEGSCERYMVPVDSPYCFRQASIATICRTIGDRSVDVSVSDLYASMLLMTELGPRGVHLQMQPLVWARLLAYTHWPPPAYPHRGDFSLCDGTGDNFAANIHLRTPQFQLVGEDTAVTQGTSSEEACESR